MHLRTIFLTAVVVSTLMGSLVQIITRAEVPVSQFAPVAASEPARLYPLTSVRLLNSPFSDAVKANATYLLALDTDRLLAPFRREAGLEPRKPSYADWESQGLDGHTAGHYLSALSTMIASGNDPEGELKRRLEYMISELGLCQQKNGDGYIGGIPGSKIFWTDFASGRFKAGNFDINRKWAPWYNMHKLFAGLRDAYTLGGNTQAKTMLIRLGDWCEKVTAGLSQKQMQDMLRAEHGGMNEVLADIYALTGDNKYLILARHFTHSAVVDPLMRKEDKLTGMHANTQIPKIIGLQRIAALSVDGLAAEGARYFWQTVIQRRTIAFGGNSVSEHFNSPGDFKGMLEHREGPETCNTYNMLRLTEQLFTASPDAFYADYYERALFNHILSSINTKEPGYVYFTPIRPGHYRVYSTPEKHFWCCVGTGMENPGKYGEFIYAAGEDGSVYVNLFIASELKAPEHEMVIRQETSFPDEPRTRISMKLSKPKTFALKIRHPAWVAANDLSIRINGIAVKTKSVPSSYVTLSREWCDGDKVEIEVPMRTTLEKLPDNSSWRAIMRGPILMGSPAGTANLDGLHGENGHTAKGPVIPLDKMPSLVGTQQDIVAHVITDPGAPLRGRLTDIADPAPAEGIALVPFFRIHDSRYQIYWDATSQVELASKRQRVAAEERAALEREQATLDSVAPGEQQPEVDHGFVGTDSSTGTYQGRKFRHGKLFQYTLSVKDGKAADLVFTIWSSDKRQYDIFLNDVLLTTFEDAPAKSGAFVDKRYPIPAAILAAAPEGKLTIRFVGKPSSLAGGIYDVRLMKSQPTIVAP
ncbi:MAG TPA: beta-L-arabinofuranosidase domain-containing protein [Candidatus Methylacidiphilales bacterium]|nr:beta-L-arabinofuranosidase domain-containing protein [Candidatus Methylacidiphilales bacterium]